MQYLKYLKKLDNITTDSGESVEVYELLDEIDSDAFDEWSTHFRNQYCSDEILDDLVRGSGLSKKDFLLQYKFPDSTSNFGPATRSGDFAELLISDYLEFILGYFVPRERYKHKFNRNTSTQGTDVMAFLVQNEKNSKYDEFVTFEVKAQSSDGRAENKLQEAIDHSYKDAIRKGESLNAVKQILIEKNRIDDAKIIERFQNKADRPYVEKYGAAAIHTSSTFSESLIKQASSTKGDRWMVVIKKNNLMSLIHKLYGRAAEC